jgi:hypothetical protein
MNKSVIYYYRYLLTLEEARIKVEKKLHPLKQWDNPVMKLPVTYIRRDPYYTVGSLRWRIAEQAHRRPGRPRRL